MTFVYLPGFFERTSPVERLRLRFYLRESRRLEGPLRVNPAERRAES
jgi:hypothetical protein